MFITRIVYVKNSLIEKNCSPFSPQITLEKYHFLRHCQGLIARIQNNYAIPAQLLSLSLSLSFAPSFMASVP